MSEHVKEVTDHSFEKEVLQSERPVLVDFWAQWCPPCRIMLPTIKEVAAEYEGRATIIKLNVDENPATAQRYGIKSIPTMILFKDGKEVERVIGATSKESLSQLLAERIGLVGN
ncbi:MAG: thioredoxin [Acidobacteriota bacterium]